MLSFTASISKEAFDYCLHVYIAHLAAVQSIQLTQYQHRWISGVGTLEGIVITRMVVC